MTHRGWGQCALFCNDVWETHHNLPVKKTIILLLPSMALSGRRNIKLSQNNSVPISTKSIIYWYTENYIKQHCNRCRRKKLTEFTNAEWIYAKIIRWINWTVDPKRCSIKVPGTPNPVPHQSVELREVKFPSETTMTNLDLIPNRPQTQNPAAMVNSTTTALPW
jgi:hypothetical protein